MKSLEYLEQMAKTEVIDCTYNDKAKKTIGQIFPVGIAEIQKDLEKLEYYRSQNSIVGDFEKGDKQLWWEHIRIIVDDKTREIWQTSEEILDDKVITLNDCLEIAKKELDYECEVMIIICESYLSGIIYRYGNYPNCNDFEIAGRMHGFA